MFDDAYDYWPRPHRTLGSDTIDIEVPTLEDQCIQFAQGRDGRPHVAALPPVAGSAARSEADQAAWRKYSDVVQRTAEAEVELSSRQPAG